MNKKSFFVLLVICIGLLMPNEVFAIYTHHESLIEIDYQIIDSQNRKDLKYKLYDKSKTLNIESVFDSSSNSYLLKKNLSEEERDVLFSNLMPDVTRQFDLLIDKDYFFEDDEYKSTIQSSKLLNLGKCEYAFDGGGPSNLCTSYGLVPLILEQYQGSKLLNKKVVFASVHNSVFWHMNRNNGKYDSFWEEFIFSFINHNLEFYQYSENYSSYYDEYWLDISESNHNPNNISFMKDTSYDYSDDLWNELNSIKISSSEVDNQVEDILPRTNDNKEIYSKYSSNVNYKFKVKNGNGMDFKLYDISNTFNFTSSYDKGNDTYSIESNNNDSNYQEGIKEFSSIIIDSIKNGKFNELSNEYKSITSKDCSSTSCEINTYIPLILEGENSSKYTKKIVLGLVDIKYRQESGKDYYDVSLNVYNNTCGFLNNSNSLNADQSKLINFSRAVVEDYSSSLMDKYSNGSVSIEEISSDNNINNLDEYCDNVPVLTLRQNPKTFNNGIIVLILSMIIVVGFSYVFLKKKSKVYL